MEKKLPEIIFGSSDSNRSKEIIRLQRKNLVRKLIPRVYTSNLIDSDEVIVKRNLWIILGHLYPGAILSHRSALEGGPTSDGHIFLTYKYKKIINYAGFTIHLLPGPKATSNDPDFIAGLYISSQARAFMENLLDSRQTSSITKTLERTVIEDRLDQLCRIKGEGALNQLRDEAQNQASNLDMEKAYQKLTLIISAILSTHSDTNLHSPLTKARAQGWPYDPQRLELFSMLFSRLQSSPLPTLSESQHSDEARRLFAFFEAYFSNYIEGTVFELEEAKDIVFNQLIPEQRPTDAHDVLSTFKVISNSMEMNQSTKDYESYQDLLQSRHLTVMAMRTDKSPGQFKLKSNRAGRTHFVEPDLVKGTLLKGWEMQQGLPDAISKAIFQMFLVSEVHPFEDGNGRIARIMMNAELSQSNLQKIIIPTVYRENYLLALRALSRSQNPGPLIEALLKAQSFSSQIDFGDWDSAVEGLTRSNAFEESDEARLILPGQNP
ncbi:MAG: Fic family protein [Candidatus Marinimicrobia bacterium]|nr:Fic family protein [Candidatus Neomarinimicrobiota bacterium]